ncbi:GNAT family N-acetyltransferase [Phenylobacterium sp. J426]|uniref:GNAT family N-acetyltransferase n=1 Tax=Phenylobacterium sp. J426 TaxID=2898439 RepID=UPI0021518231|nr:GNAT family N-acetyltransferase [Phenylobacterium sp. J426]MCR5873985.1 GNAT family N-acetyltransferase [Phenylobacterium sp. J426]
MPQPALAPAFVVFPPGPADAEALAYVHVQSWRETYNGLLPAGYLARMSEVALARRFHRQLGAGPGLAPAITLAAADRFGLVGYAQAGPSRRGVPGEGEISVLYLLSSAQGRGLGRRLLTETARALAAQGATSLMISVLRENFGARGFYEHLGGVAEPARREPGPGGTLLYEVAYRWGGYREAHGVALTSPAQRREGDRRPGRRRRADGGGGERLRLRPAPATIRSSARLRGPRRTVPLPPSLRDGGGELLTDCCQQSWAIVLRHEEDGPC